MGESNIQDGCIERGVFHTYTDEQMEYLRQNGFTMFRCDAESEALLAHVTAQHGPGKCSCNQEKEKTA